MSVRREVGAGPDAGRSASSSGRIRLSPEEERVFRKVDGVRTVQAIIDATGSGEFEVCRTLFDFLNRNLVARAGRGTTPEAEVEARPTAASSVPGYAVAVLVALLAFAGLVVQWRSPFAVAGLPAPLRPAYEALVEDWARSRLMRGGRPPPAWPRTHSV